MNRWRMERRSALAALAGTLGALAAPGLARAAAATGGGRATDAVLRARLAHADAAALKAVAAHLPAEPRIGRTPAESARRLTDDLGTTGGTAGGDPAGGVDAAAVGRAIRADFAAGRTVSCDGWQLSLTEARVAALWRPV